jgi:CheY-like chemotaxis protein
MKLNIRDQKTVRILLADDDEDDRLFFRDAIEELPLKTLVTTVNDGEKLMDYLLNPKVTLPHVIFLDLNMPIKNGMECLTEIRNHPDLKDLSIAIYSTSLSSKDIEETFIKGANIYINKPHDFDALKTVLNKVICTNWQYLNSSLNKETFLLSI